MSDLADKVDALFAKWDSPDSPGCALATIQDGEILYKRAYGMADLERNIPLSPASVFDLGSTGKQFTAMIITILARQGVLSLDDIVQKYVPEMPSYEQPITIRHMLHHTSGLRDYTTLVHLSDMHFENYYYEEELLALICRQKELNFRPGDEYLYSNTGYFLLGIIAKRITGKSLPELIREHILEPLGMHATDFNDDVRRIVKNRAIGYSREEGGAYRTEMSFCGGYGDGAVLSTVEDLALWDQNFYANRLGGGGQELIHQMLLPGTLNSGEALDYASGLSVGRYRGLSTVSHGGAWAGYTAELLRFPDQKLSVICLANASSIDPWQLAREVADLYLADCFPEQKPGAGQETAESFDLPARQIESLAGFYRNERAGNMLELSIQDGKLGGEAFGVRFPLATASPTRLKAQDVSFDILIEFEASHPASALTVSGDLQGSKAESYRKMSVTPIAPAQLPDYVGDYYSDELGVKYAVTLDGEQLSLRRGFSPKGALRPVTRDLFTCGDLEIEFSRNQQDQVEAFSLRESRVRNIRFTR
jgi:CubicO group peptidase (beta-lactamase class C family)